MVRRPERLVLDRKRLFPLLMQSNGALNCTRAAFTQKLYGKESPSAAKIYPSASLASDTSTVDAKLTCTLRLLARWYRSVAFPYSFTPIARKCIGKSR
jgi:hypothetical protein